MKLYRLNFKRKIVFSQSDEQGLAMNWYLKIVPPGTEVENSYKC